jgi:hypothetical protein
MEAFAHLSILLSIILGLGITELLGGFARLIERRRATSVYGPAIAWAALLLLAHVQTWWTIFGYRGLHQWTFLAFFVVLLQPIVLYLLSVLSFPRSASSLDLRANYYEHRRWFFALFASLLVVSIVKDLVVAGSLPSGTNLAFHALLFAIAAVGIATANETVHRIVSYGALLLIVLYIGLLFSRLA